jgi:hypothetical protein
MTQPPAEDASVDELYASTFRALAEPVRLDMLRQIASVSEMPCTALQAHTGLAKSTVFYHIKILRGGADLGSQAGAELLLHRRPRRHPVAASGVPRARECPTAPEGRHVLSRGPGTASQPTSRRSIAPPCPPPPQIVAIPCSTDRCCISRLSVWIIRNPEAPRGWPTAIAPPFTFTASRLTSRSRAVATTPPRETTPNSTPRGRR